MKNDFAIIDLICIHLRNSKLISKDMTVMITEIKYHTNKN